MIAEAANASTERAPQKHRPRCRLRFEEQASKPEAVGEIWNEIRLDAVEGDELPLLAMRGEGWPGILVVVSLADLPIVGRYVRDIEAAAIAGAR